MDETFDPYRKWLGIAPEEQPAHHYRLLGLALFESDPDVISNAADARMAHVKRFQTGQHADMSQEILNRLAAAKVCLLRPDSKAEYDRHLQASLESQAQAVVSSPPRAVPVPPPAAPPIGADAPTVAPPPQVAVKPSAAYRRRRRKTPWPAVWGIIVLLAILGLAALAMLARP